MRHIEDNLQMACVRWFAFQYPRLTHLLHHSPNGGRRDEREAARFKAMGVRAGFPDLILCVPKGSCGALFLELKAPKGRQSEHQREMQRELERQGYKYVIVRSLDEFMANINNYLRYDTKTDN